jgi:hypothetical protein
MSFRTFGKYWYTCTLNIWHLIKQMQSSWLSLYICFAPFKLIWILICLAWNTLLKNMSHAIMLCMHLLCFLDSSACKASTPGLVYDTVGLYTNRSYTCSTKVSFNQSLMFSIHDFVHVSASTPFMLCVQAFTLMQFISSHALIKPFHHNMHS